MQRRLVTLALALALAAAPIFAKGTAEEKVVQRSARVAKKIQSIGTGDKARVRVELANKTVLEGSIVSTSQDSFTLLNKATGAEEIVTYTQVGKVKGHHLSTAAKVGIGAATAVAIAVIVLFATNEDEIEFPL